MRVTYARVAVVLALVLAAALTGCVRVKYAYERSYLAAPCMDAAATGELGPEYDAKLHETRTGGGLAGTAPGGGCGCTQ